jgi:hypothetical protein
VLENSGVHAKREGHGTSRDIDFFSSMACQAGTRPLVAEPAWWMLRVGILSFAASNPAA